MTGIEVDKTKRRLIRTVARLLLQEKKPEEEIWEDLKKETGCDCKLLWSLMRAVTLKKLDRLLAANDCMNAVPEPARMSVTDWLLVDLVLVHQDVDLIGQNISKMKDFPALVELFKLVTMFKLEKQGSDKLAEAWSLAALSYNNRGHHCSPMLLQRRWYQLKEATRTNFYKFWYMYRGSVQRIEMSAPFKPSPLQIEIVTAFNELIVQPYGTWEELIEKKMVIMPDELEKKMKERKCRRRSTSAPKSTEDVPDLVMIEPRIETLDLSLEPDVNATEEDKHYEEEHYGEVYVPPLVPIIKIKQEPQHDSNETQIQLPKKSIYEVVLESTALEYEQINSMYAEDFSPGNYDGDVEEIQVPPVREEEESTLPLISKQAMFGNVSDTNVLANVDEHLVYLNTESVIGKDGETNVIANLDETAVTGNVDNICVNGKNEDTSAHIPSANTLTAYPTVIAALNAPKITTDRRSKDKPVEIDSTPQVVDITSPEPLKVSLTAERQEGRDVKLGITGFNFGEPTSNISFAVEGIEFLDDGIPYVDVDGHDEPNIKSDAGNEDEDTPKIDAKLLMCPIVNTTRLDDMYMFYRQPFDHVTDKHFLDEIARKSKQAPKEIVENVTINCLGGTIKSVTVNNTKTIEKIQNTVSTIEKVSVNNDSIEIINKEPVIVDSETSADVEHNPENDENDDDESEYVIDESQKVKPTSYLLQKPRSRRYNPIQLCKNPDFNTRLKRLSLGFYSHPRNLVLIKSCKPLTVDISKEFEFKLVSGTLYLKPLDHNVVEEVIDDIQSQNVSVLPSALPAQSLIDKSKVADILPILRQCLEASKQLKQPSPENLPTATERNNIISLPDFTEIGRINQRFLTMEVKPIQVLKNQPQVPVTIVSSPTCAAQNPVTIPKTEQHLLPKVTEANDARGPPKLLDITDDFPAKSSTYQHPTITTIHNTRTSTGINTFDTLRPRLQELFSGRLPRMQNEKRLLPPRLPKPPVWKPRQFRPEIPWLLKSNEVNVSSMVKETLLTVDALNKMLFLFSKTPEANKTAQKKLNCNAKRKSKTRQMKHGPRQPKTYPDDHSVMLVSDKEDEASETQKYVGVTPKPKINIKPATNYPPVKEKKGGATDYSKKKVKYCCWSKRRLLQILFRKKSIPAHRCDRLCTCCCRSLLAKHTLQAQQIKSAEENTTTANQPTNTEDIEDDVPELGCDVSVKTTAVLQTAAAVLTDPPSGARD